MLHATAAITAIGGLIGLSIGAFGIGGVFLPPLLAALGLDLHRAMATSLATFVFTGLLGALLYQKERNIDWPLALALGLASVPGAFLGARTNVSLPEDLLRALLAILLLGAGTYILLQPRGQRPMSSLPRRSILGLGGFAMGFVSGLTGVGGPLVVVPVMVLLGTPILLAVGISQVFCLLSSLGGSAGYLLSGAIDYRVMALILVGELPGVYLGSSVAHRATGRSLRRLLGLLCLLVGFFYLLPG